MLSTCKWYSHSSDYPTSFQKKFLNFQKHTISDMSIQYIRLSYLILFTCLIGCAPQEETTWYKGNLHTHTYWSDGDAFPEMVLDWYKTNGYQFVALSEHNIIAQGEKWKKIPKSVIYEQALTDYQNKYGADWVESREDSSGVNIKLKTAAEYLPLFEESGKFLIIPAEEITDRFEGKPLHMNATNIQELIVPKHGNSVVETLQNNINSVLEQREATGVPIMPHINHPNFGWGISVDDMKALRGERFFEVFNGHPGVRNYGDSLHISTEEMWDQINIAYLERGQPFMYGIATDDSHHYHRFGGQFSNSGRGWVMVRSESLSPASLIEAMEAGNFYASSGVTLNDLKQRDGKIYIDINAEPGVSYKVDLIGVKKGARKSEVLESTTGTKVTYTLGNEILFARIRITSSKIKDNPFQKGDFEMAWTQPIVR